MRNPNNAEQQFAREKIFRAIRTFMNRREMKEKLIDMGWEGFECPKTQCRHGLKCYRKNLRHFENWDHPPQIVANLIYFYGQNKVIID